MMLGVAAAVASPAFAQTPPFTAQESATRLEIRFSNLALKGTVPNPAQNEIALSFANPVPDSIFSALEKAWPQWISFSFSGYDSAVVRAARPVRFSTRSDGDGFVLTLDGSDAAAGTEAGTADPVAIQRARLLSEAGDAPAAREAFAQLIQQYPRDVSVRRAAGDAEMRTGNPATALDHYDAALSLAPDDAALRAARVSALREIGSFVRLGTDFQRVEDADSQRQSDGEARIHLGGGVAIALRAEDRGTDDEEVREPSDGSIVAYDDRAQRGEVSLVYARDGIEARVGATGQIGGEIGVVAALLRRTPVDEAGLRVAFHEPWWETTEAIRSHGTRDNVELTYFRRLTPSLSVNVGLRAARYGIGGEDDLARTIGFSAGLRQRWQLGRGEISLGYNVDGRYVLDSETRFDALLQPYQPVDIVDSEIHALDVSLGAMLTPGLRSDFYAGFAYDRYAGSGPFGGLTLTFSPSDNLEIAIDGSYASVSGRAGEDGAVARAGIGATWRFAPPGSE